jgi:hypothetical protein
MFHELARLAPSVELDRLYRFSQAWEADATLQLRHSNPAAVDTYLRHGRIRFGTFDEHLDTIISTWLESHSCGERLAVTVGTNDHAATINRAIQRARAQRGQLDTGRHGVASDGGVYVGDVIATRRNLRSLMADDGTTVHNRDRWIITDLHSDGSITARRERSDTTVTLPSEYVAGSVELAYAATDYGNQGDTYDRAITLVTPTTTARGLYVAMTRGRNHNLALVTDTHDLDHARDVLEHVLTNTRADRPAHLEREHLARHTPVEHAVTREPDWLMRCRTNVERSLTATRIELAALAHRAERDRDRLRSEMELLEASCGPADRALAEVTARFEALRDRTAAALHSHSNAGRWKQRSTNRQLVSLNEALTRAHTEETALRTANPQLKRRRQLAHDIIESDQRYRLEERHLSRRLEQLQRLKTSVDVWSSAAAGRCVDPVDLDEATRLLQAAFGDETDLAQPFQRHTDVPVLRHDPVPAVAEVDLPGL